MLISISETTICCVSYFIITVSWGVQRRDRARVLTWINCLGSPASESPHRVSLISDDSHVVRHPAPFASGIYFRSGFAQANEHGLQATGSGVPVTSVTRG